MARSFSELNWRGPVQIPRRCGLATSGQWMLTGYGSWLLQRQMPYSLTTRVQISLTPLRIAGDDFHRSVAGDLVHIPLRVCPVCPGQSFRELRQLLRCYHSIRMPYIDMQ